MPSGMFWGEFAKGLAGGLRNAEEMRLKSEEHKLRSKMLEHQLKKMDYDESQRQQQAIQREEQAKELGKLTEMLTQGMPGQAPAPLQPGQEGPEPAPGFEVPRTPASREQILGQGLKSIPQEHRYNLLQEYMKPVRQPTGAGDRPMVTSPGQIVVDREGKVIYTNPNQREGVGVQSQVWSRIVRENPGAPLSVLTEKYTDEMSRYRYGTGAASSAGTVAGGAAQTIGEPIEPMQPFAPSPQAPPRPGTPPPPSAPLTPPFTAPTPTIQPTLGPPGETPAQKAARLKKTAETAGQPLPSGLEETMARGGMLRNLVDEVRKSVKPEFLGPVRGSQTGFEFLRRFGSTVGSPLKEGETNFRQTLQTMRNVIVYLQTGKQINEAEAGRLNAAMPDASDEYGVFLEGLNTFERVMDDILSEHRKAGSMTRGQLGGGGAAPAGRLVPRPRQ